MSSAYGRWRSISCQTLPFRLLPLPLTGQQVLADEMETRPYEW